MMRKVEFKLTSDKEIRYQMASVFQGLLMENVSRDIGDKLHVSKLHPYSQHLERRGKSWYWIVNCMNDRAVNEIVEGKLGCLKSFYIKKHDMQVDIESIKENDFDPKETSTFYLDNRKEMLIKLNFQTATAFKKDGRYLIYPEIRCIYQSLINKYMAIEDMEGYDKEELIHSLCDATSITSYNLRSTKFHLEGVKIPAFIGRINLKIKGDPRTVGFADFLFKVGEFSGVGIKTAIGMGAIKREV